MCDPSVWAQSVVGLSIVEEVTANATSFSIASGFFVAPFLVVTTWAFVQAQAGAIRVHVPYLGTAATDYVDGVLVHAVPQWNVAFVHVNPSQWMVGAHNHAPHAHLHLHLHGNPTPGEQVLAADLSHPAMGVLGAQDPDGLTGVSGMNSRGVFPGTALLRASDCAVVGMIVSVDTEEVLARDSRLLHWAVSTYAPADSQWVPGYGTVPSLRGPPQLAVAVPGFAADLNAFVPVYVPVPVYTSVHVSDCAGGVRANPRPSLVQSRILPQGSLYTMAIAGTAVGVASPDGWFPDVTNAAMGMVRVVPEKPQYVEFLWTHTATPITVGTTDVSSAAGGPGRVFAFPKGRFTVNYNPDTQWYNSLPYMLVYADLGLVVFAPSVAHPPAVSTLVGAICDPDSAAAASIPYIAPLASAAMRGATVTYSLADEGTVYTVTWSSVEIGVEVQVVYDADLGSVFVVHRTMPVAWPVTDAWLAGTAMTGRFSAPGVVATTRSIALATLPRSLELVNYGLAHCSLDLRFVPSAQGTGGQGALVATTSRRRTLYGTFAYIAVDPNSYAVFVGSGLVDAAPDPTTGTVCVMAVNGSAAAPLPVALAQLAPNASARAPVPVVLTIARAGTVPVPRPPLPAPYLDRLWSSPAVITMGAPPKASRASHAAVAMDFGVAVVGPAPYSAAAFALPQAEAGVQQTIVSATFALDVDPLGPPSHGDTFIIQLASSSAGKTLSTVLSGRTPTSAVFTCLNGTAWVVAYGHGYVGVGDGPDVPYTLGSAFTLGHEAGGGVTTVVVGVPPLPGTRPLPPGRHLLARPVVTVKQLVPGVMVEHHEVLRGPLFAVI